MTKTFDASKNWPHYSQEPRYYNKRTGTFYRKVGGRLVPVRNHLGVKARRAKLRERRKA